MHMKYGLCGPIDSNEFFQWVRGMFTLSQDSKKPATRSRVLVLLAWVFIGGQALLAAGSMYSYMGTEKQVQKQDQKQGQKATIPWPLIGQGAVRMRLLAAQARPEILGNIAVFLAVANTLGLAALMCGVLAWSRSKHTSGKLAIAAAVTIILVNSILNLPYA
jgi:cytochrome bd-type quinol oxidase subunit 2